MLGVKLDPENLGNCRTCINTHLIPLHKKTARLEKIASGEVKFKNYVI